MGGSVKQSKQAGRKPVTSSALAMKTSAAAVLERAQDMGLMAAGTRLVGARLPMKLLARAKKRTGISSTTELLAFALANVAVDDDFAKVFVAARGKLDPDLDIGL